MAEPEGFVRDYMRIQSFDITVARMAMVRAAKYPVDGRLAAYLVGRALERAERLRPEDIGDDPVMQASRLLDEFFPEEGPIDTPDGPKEAR